MMVEVPESILETYGRNRASNTTAMRENSCGDCGQLMEAVVERERPISES
ncbi:MAG TPA: hypothetical protein VHO70_03875 [Chitinispirillaceae bacterium]|nr:hypothetical protein [Chitinispirillaceae bacterium]